MIGWGSVEPAAQSLFVIGNLATLAGMVCAYDGRLLRVQSEVDGNGNQYGGHL
jgi:hypothetical protein